MPITKKEFKKWADGTTIPAVVYTPKNLKTGEKCALIIFAHGVGEAGDGTLKQIDKVINNFDAAGPMAYAMKVDDFAALDLREGNPVPIKFIVISFQGRNGWGPNAI